MLLLTLTLPLYIIFLPDAESISNNDGCFPDIVDTMEECIAEHGKRQSLKGVLSKRKILGGKKQWLHERVDKAGFTWVDLPDL